MQSLGFETKLHDIIYKTDTMKKVKNTEYDLPPGDFIFLIHLLKAKIHPTSRLML